MRGDGSVDVVVDCGDEGDRAEGLVHVRNRAGDGPDAGAGRIGGGARRGEDAGCRVGEGQRCGDLIAFGVGHEDVVEGDAHVVLVVDLDLIEVRCGGGVVPGRDVDDQLETGAGVAKIIEVAIVLADDEVEVAITVEVDEARCAGFANADVIERIRRSGPLREDRGASSACVFEIGQATARNETVVFADGGIEIPVAVHIGQCGLTPISDIEPVERVGGTAPFRERRCNRRSRIIKISDCAGTCSHDGIEIAVGVEIGERGKSYEIHVNAIEGIGCAGLLNERRRGCRPGIEVVKQRAVVVADDDV